MTDDLVDKVKAKARRLEARAERLEEVQEALIHLREHSGPNHSYPIFSSGQMRLVGYRGAVPCFHEFEVYVERNWQTMRQEMIDALSEEEAEIRAEFDKIQDAPEADHD